GGHVGGGFGGGHFNGFGGSHFGGPRVGSFNGGGIRAAPTFSGARFSANRSIGGPRRGAQRVSYYRGAPPPAIGARASTRQPQNRSISSNPGGVASANRQSNRVNSAVGQKQVTNPRVSTAQNRQAFVKNHAFARHDGSWHRDWDRHQAHFDHGHVFV